MLSFSTNQEKSHPGMQLIGHLIRSRSNELSCCMLVSLCYVTCSEVLWIQKLRSPQLEPRDDRCSSIKPWSRSEYSQACFTHCQEFLPCPNFYLPGPFTIIFSKSCPYCLTVLVLANTASHLGHQNKIESPC